MDERDIIPARQSCAGAVEGLRGCRSRRGFIAGGSLSLALASGLIPALGRQRLESAPCLRQKEGAPSSPPPTLDSGSLTSATDFTGRLSTPVSIDGYGPYRLLVDTGAERTVIAADVADCLALPRGREVLVQGIVRGEPARLVEIRRLGMGSLVCSQLEVPTLPRAMLDADGYLGLDVLDGRRVVFDFRARTLTISRPQGFFSALWTRDDEVRVRTLGDSGRLRATDCVIDGVHAAAFLDTGAEVSVINQVLYAALQRHNPSQTLHTMEALTGVTGGTVLGVATLLDMISLGELVLTFATAVVADLPVFKIWGLNEQPALLIGMDCLRRCRRVSIDYGRKELRFEVASAGIPRGLQADLPLAG